MNECKKASLLALVTDVLSVLKKAWIKFFVEDSILAANCAARSRSVANVHRKFALHRSSFESSRARRMQKKQAFWLSSQTHTSVIEGLVKNKTIGFNNGRSLSSEESLDKVFCGGFDSRRELRGLVAIGRKRPPEVCSAPIVLRILQGAQNAKKASLWATYHKAGRIAQERPF